MLFVIASAAALIALTWPQGFGLNNDWVIAHAVSLRGVGVVVAVALAAVFLLLCTIRRFRPVLGTLSVLLLLFGVVNAGILLARGTSVGSSAEATDAAGAVTILSWNTLGDAPGAAAIAELALAENADVVTLPETTKETGIAIAEAMRDGGRPMWVHTLAFDQIAKSRSTTVLISPDLGDYTVTSDPGSGPPGNTNVLPTVVASPSDGTGPTIVAVHAVAPIQYEMSNWRSDLDWLADQCGGENVIMAGDFNSTIDHMAGRSGSNADAVLGRCEDAAQSAGSAAAGTWPTWLPPLLGSPIDHIMATPNWKVENLQVIESTDSAGSDHRPLVATLLPDE